MTSSHHLPTAYTYAHALHARLRCHARRLLRITSARLPARCNINAPAPLLPRARMPLLRFMRAYCCAAQHSNAMHRFYLSSNMDIVISYGSVTLPTPPHATFQPPPPHPLPRTRWRHFVLLPNSVATTTPAVHIFFGGFFAPPFLACLPPLRTLPHLPHHPTRHPHLPLPHPTPHPPCLAGLMGWSLQVFCYHSPAFTIHLHPTPVVVGKHARCLHGAHLPACCIFHLPACHFLRRLRCAAPAHHLPSARSSRLTASCLPSSPCTLPAYPLYIPARERV